MEDVVIYGAGGTSRDTLEALEAVNADSRRWNILGFVDDRAALHGTEIMDYPVLGGGSRLCDHGSLAHMKIVLGVANHQDGLVRKQIRERYGFATSRFPIIVHPLATVSKRAELGAGSIFLAGSSCATSVSIGQHVIVLQGASIGHDANLSDYATVSANAAIGGGAQIGEGAYVGLGAAILPGVRIGRASTVGIGAVVLTDIPEQVIAIGNPARTVRSTVAP